MQSPKIVTCLLLLLAWFHLDAQEKKDSVKVSGVIKDAATGKNIGGIRVTYKDFSAAITDSNGGFVLNVPSPYVSVLMEGEGYQSKQIALKGRSHITTSLYEDTYTSFL
ncbi:MAG: hypothetical protein WDO16_12035 [Bacteroidota bacterium]